MLENKLLAATSFAIMVVVVMAAVVNNARLFSGPPGWLLCWERWRLFGLSEEEITGWNKQNKETFDRLNSCQVASGLKSWTFYCFDNVQEARRDFILSVISQLGSSWLANAFWLIMWVTEACWEQWHYCECFTGPMMHKYRKAKMPNFCCVATATMKEWKLSISLYFSYIFRFIY